MFLRNSLKSTANMKDVLEEILAHKRLELATLKNNLSPRFLYSEVEKLMLQDTPVYSMSQALRESSSGIIAEFKRKSPSKGWIRKDALPQKIMLSYAQNGASALSILTDEHYFGGSAQFIRDVRPLVQTPILRKEFIVDEYQLFEAKHMGADAVLLIAAALPLAACRTLIDLAHELRLEVLLELHAEHELDYAGLEADMLGVNNRNLGTFVTDIQNSFRMITRLPQERVLVSESGISGPETVHHLRQAGYRGFLMGENFMKEPDPGIALKQFIAAL